jgi:hypothetical protein
VPNGSEVLVVDVLVGAVVATAGFGRVLGIVVAVAGRDPVGVPPVVVVVTDGADEGVVVVTGAGVWAGGTSVEALQICAYDADAAGGGSLELSGSSV